MYRIRAFGNDRQCSDIADLQESLRRDYRGQSVSIVFAARPHGLLRTEFVDVRPDGQVLASYGNQAEVDFAALARDAQVSNARMGA
jgi:hypothetical protein